jgi:hypothetical protein
MAPGFPAAENKMFLTSGENNYRIYDFFIKNRSSVFRVPDSRQRPLIFGRGTRITSTRPARRRNFEGLIQLPS